MQYKARKLRKVCVKPAILVFIDGHERIIRRFFASSFGILTERIDVPVLPVHQWIRRIATRNVRSLKAFGHNVFDFNNTSFTKTVTRRVFEKFGAVYNVYNVAVRLSSN